MGRKDERGGAIVAWLNSTSLLHPAALTALLG